MVDDIPPLEIAPAPFCPLLNCEDDTSGQEVSTPPEVATGKVFEVLDEEEPEDTWERVFKEIKDALYRHGHTGETKLKQYLKVC